MGSESEGKEPGPGADIRQDLALLETQRRDDFIGFLFGCPLRTLQHRNIGFGVLVQLLYLFCGALTGGILKSERCCKYN